MRAWNKVKQIWGSTDLAKTLEFNQQLREFRSFFSNGKSPKMLVFGDSVASYVARDDNSKESLEVLFKEQSRDFADTLVAAGRAYHSEIFYSFCRLITRLPYQPQLVIVPINLRSFSPSWDLNPEFQLLEELSKLRTIYDGRVLRCNRKDRSFTSDVIFRSIPLKYPGKPLLTIGEYRDISKNKPASETDRQWAARLDHVFTFHYMFPIYQQHRKLKSLCDMVDLLGELEIPVLFYFTPINYEAGFKYVGERFLEVVNGNIQIIEERLRHFNMQNNQDGDEAAVTVANYAFSCDSSAFFSQHNSTEHLRYEHRLALVNKLLAIGRKMIVD